MTSRAFMKDFLKMQNDLKANFPKRCSICKSEYKNLDEFVKRTSRLACDKDSFCYFGIQLRFRNCNCGSTLAVKIS